MVIGNGESIPTKEKKVLYCIEKGMGQPTVFIHGTQRFPNLAISD
jgi:hypothetical protein